MSVCYATSLYGHSVWVLPLRECAYTAFDHCNAQSEPGASLLSSFYCKIVMVSVYIVKKLFSIIVTLQALPSHPFWHLHQLVSELAGDETRFLQVCVSCPPCTQPYTYSQSWLDRVHWVLVGLSQRRYPLHDLAALYGDTIQMLALPRRSLRRIQKVFCSLAPSFEWNGCHSQLRQKDCHMKTFCWLNCTVGRPSVKLSQT